MKSNSTLQYRVKWARDIEAKDNETQINVFVNLAYLFLIEMTLLVRWLGFIRRHARRQWRFILYKKQIIDLLYDEGLLFLTMCNDRCKGNHSTSPSNYKDFVDQKRYSKIDLENIDKI